MTAIYVKAIPQDLVEFILTVQGTIKAQKKVGKYSQSQTIIHMIKEYKKTIEKNG